MHCPDSLQQASEYYSGPDMMIQSRVMASKMFYGLKNINMLIVGVERRL